jgi:hypothetical protein
MPPLHASLQHHIAKGSHLIATQHCTEGHYLTRNNSSGSVFEMVWNCVSPMLVSAAETATSSRAHMPQPQREMSARLCWNAGILLQMCDIMLECEGMLVPFVHLLHNEPAGWCYSDNTAGGQHLMSEYTGGVHRKVGTKYQALVLNRKLKRSAVMTLKNTCRTAAWQSCFPFHKCVCSAALHRV